MDRSGPCDAAKGGGSPGRELDAVDITVVGSPEDHAVGGGDAQLERFLATARRLAAEHGLEIEDVTEKQRAAWRSRGRRG